MSGLVREQERSPGWGCLEVRVSRDWACCRATFTRAEPPSGGEAIPPAKGGSGSSLKTFCAACVMFVWSRRRCFTLRTLCPGSFLLNSLLFVCCSKATEAVGD